MSCWDLPSVCIKKNRASLGLPPYVSLTKFVEFTQVDLLSLAVLQVDVKSGAY